MQQKTLKKSCVLRGIGVHSGQPSTLTIEPAAIDAGISWVHQQTGEVFVMGQAVPVQAPHATVLATKNARISTIEHVMAAVWQQGVTNAVCRLDGDEAPILDGSSIAIIWALQEIGIIAQDAPARMITPRQTLTFVDEQRGGSIIIHPVDEGQEGLVLEYNVSSRTRFGIHDSAVDSRLRGNDNICDSREQFLAAFAPARTCGDIEQLDALRAHGLARGSTLGNTIARMGGQYLNTPRFDDEPQRHKVLDLIGDLYLLGAPLIGRIQAQNTGHSFNRQVVAHYVNNPEMWRLVSKHAHEVGVGQSKQEQR